MNVETEARLRQDFRDRANTDAKIMRPNRGPGKKAKAETSRGRQTSKQSQGEAA